MVGTEIESIIVPEGGMYAEMALAPGQVMGNNVFLGSWATTESITSVSFVRNNLAVTLAFKGEIAYVQKIFIPKGVRIQTGITGPQIFNGVIYQGGAPQIQILNIIDKNKIIQIGKPRPIK